MAKARKIRLSIFLLSSGTMLDTCVTQELETIPLGAEYPFEGRIYFDASKSMPKWTGFVASLAAKEIKFQSSQSVSALVCIKIQNRIFAITFGFSRHWIDEEAIERRFGLICVVNSIDPEEVTTLQSFQYESTAVATRISSARPSSIGSLAFNLESALLKGLHGRCKNPILGRTISGSDNVVVSIEATPDKLLSALSELLVAYESEKYKAGPFSWIDKFQKANVSEVKEVNRRLLALIAEENYDRIFISPPIERSELDPVQFRFRNEKYDRLEPKDIFPKLKEVNIETLKSNKLEMLFDADGRAETVSVYRSIIFETTVGNKLYILNTGEVFKVDESYANEIQRRVNQIQELTNILPPFVLGQREDVYNLQVCEGDPDKLHLDKKFIMLPGRSKIEICDIFSLSHGFLHVKKGVKSQNLSHLFTQGAVSAQLMKRDEFKRDAITYLIENSHLDHDSEFANALRNEMHDVVFVIASSVSGSIRDNLPFMSKQSLLNALDILKPLGYEIRLAKVGVEG